MIERRSFLLSGAALSLLSACGGADRFADGGSVATVDPGLRPQRNAGYDAWVAAFRGRAAAKGLREDVIARAFRNAGFLPGVVERDRNQTEFKRSFEDYLSLVANEDKVLQGRAAYARERRVLDAVEAKYGVASQIVCAIWGVESNFGARMGDIPVISALSTLAYDGRRGAFFEGQLIAALKILQAGDVSPERMTGSWAGAMGHTQFIPTSYLAFAVDFTGDGRRDIWGANPADGLASTAAYLSRNGWARGGGWSREDPSGTMQPDPGGPRFSVSGNFRVIKRYNNSDSYALAVGYLADRIAGGGPLRQKFGPDRYGLTQPQRKRLQELLNRAGFDVGKPDGVLGPKSRAAIEAYQREAGLPVTGNPSPALLARLG